jgi:hypothetical protein
MFNELAETTDFACKVLRSRGLSTTNWRQIFALFLAIERVVEESEGIAAILRPCADLAPTLPAARPRFMKVGNDLFEELDKAAREMIDSMSGLCAYGSSKTLLPDQGLEEAFKHHFHPKSHWYIHFLGMYNSGRISEDGTVIERTIFHLHPAPTRQILGNDMEDHSLCASVMVDCSTEQARAAVAEGCRAPLHALKASCDAVAQLLRERCTIDDLLDSRIISKV